MKKSEVAGAWLKILRGRVPILSIEITRECPLTCPGCYAYGDTHLAGGVKLTDLTDFRGDELVGRMLDLVDRHDPIHVSIVGGEPLVRHKELSRILPELSRKGGVWTMITTSAVIPIPMEWMSLPRVRMVVSIDGLAPEHDERRKPATYEKILKNIEGRKVNIHLTVTRQMMQRSGYLDEYMSFWCARPEVLAIWFSLYSPQVGEQSPEILTPEERLEVTRQMKSLRTRHPKLLMTDGIADAFVEPPSNPSECTFSRMSLNYSADLKTKVEPCIYGGTPDCTQCGCAVTAGFEAIGNYHLLGPLKARHVMNASIHVGAFVNRFRREPVDTDRWRSRVPPAVEPLVQIRS